jgi:hypothetical protein
VPHVRRCKAPLVQCSYDAERRELSLWTAPVDGRPGDLAWTGDAEHAAQVERGGVLIRFGNGGAKVIYGE